MRSGLVQGDLDLPAVRSISANAEQTQDPCAELLSSTEHLRVCGADKATIGQGTAFDGTSPPRRSGWAPHHDGTHSARSTSAYAERTARAARASPGVTEHFRVRGTDVIGDKTKSSHRGASPRTRSRRRVAHRHVVHVRTISAYAEQARPHAHGRPCRTEHLRLRGDDLA